MNLPISPATVAAAARIAGRVVDQVGQSLSFDRVLGGAENADAPAAGQTEPSAADPSTPREWLQRAVGRIRELLAGAGLQPSEPVELSIEAGGELRLTDDHPQGAAIEAVLAGDRELGRIVEELASRGGPTTISLSPPTGTDLTRFDGAANIDRRAGGYANWLAD